MHGVISLPDATSYDNMIYRDKQINIYCEKKSGNSDGLTIILAVAYNIMMSLFIDTLFSLNCFLYW